MRKLCALFLLGATIVFPFSASAMSPLADHELAAVRGTGQQVAGSDMKAISLGPVSMLSRETFGSNASSKAGAPAFTRTSGVSIFFDVTLNLHFDVIAWGDSDGIKSSGASQPGFVGLSNTSITGMRIGARKDLIRK